MGSRWSTFSLIVLLIFRRGLLWRGSGGKQAFRSAFVSSFAESFSRVVNDEGHFGHTIFRSIVQLVDALAIVHSELNQV
jgi:hypothetical protein